LALENDWFCFVVTFPIAMTSRTLQQTAYTAVSTFGYYSFSLFRSALVGITFAVVGYIHINVLVACWLGPWLKPVLKPFVGLCVDLRRRLLTRMDMIYLNSVVCPMTFRFGTVTLGLTTCTLLALLFA